MITSYEHWAKSAKGPRIAFTGAIHGNEICGTRAIERLHQEIASGEVVLEKGSLLLIPVCNPEAYRQDRRFIEENLNRVFVRHDDPRTYEQRIANNLTKLIQDCDILVDFHSIHTAGWPFAMRFGRFSDEEESLISASGMPYIIEGWESAYAASFPGVDRGQSHHTVSFMHSLGKPAVGIECGQHKNPASVEVAYRTMKRILSYLGMIGDSFVHYPQPQFVMLEKVFIKSQEGENLIPDLTHGASIKAGQVIATTADRKEIRYEKDGLLLFPRYECPVGEELYYTGSFTTPR